MKNMKRAIRRHKERVKATNRTNRMKAICGVMVTKDKKLEQSLYNIHKTTATPCSCSICRDDKYDRAQEKNRLRRISQIDG